VFDNPALKFFGAAFKTGVVSARVARPPRVRVRFEDIDGLESHWLPVVVKGSLRNKHYHLPDIGEHVACLMDARFEEGVVVGAIYSDEDEPPIDNGECTHVRFGDGTSIDYNRESHTLTIDATGPINISTTGSVHVTAPSATVTADTIKLDSPQTTCTGKLTVTGNVQVNGNITATGRITGA
jgi:phage baseplate assembly protein V